MSITPFRSESTDSILNRAQSHSASRISIENLCPIDDERADKSNPLPLSINSSKQPDGSGQNICVPRRLPKLEGRCSPIFIPYSGSQTSAARKIKGNRTNTTHNLSQDSALSRKRKENLNISESASNLSQESTLRERKKIRRTESIHLANDPALQIFLAKMQSATKPAEN